MQINDFVTHYHSKSDEELLQLAADPSLLTPEAHSALGGELTRRKLGPTPSLKPTQIADQPQADAQAMHGLRATNSHSTGEFITEVLRLYHSHWRLFLTLMAPAVVAGYIVIYVKRELGMEITRRAFEGQATFLVSYIEIWSVQLVGYLISWIAFSYAFAAICFLVGHIQTGAAPTLTGSFAAVRRRNGSVLRISLLLFFLCCVANSAANLAFSGALWLTRYYAIHLNDLLFRSLWWILGGAGLLILSRFALSIPAVVLDNFNAGKAMFRSDELTEGKWLTLLALLSKSLIGGYVAGMCPYWLASWLLAGKSVPFGLPWFLAIASAAAVNARRTDHVCWVRFTLPEDIRRGLPGWGRSIFQPCAAGSTCFVVRRIRPRTPAFAAT